MNIDILCASLSLSVHILFHISYTQVLPQKQIVELSLPHRWPSPLPTIGIRAWMFSIPLSAAIRIRGSQLSVFICFLNLEETEKRRRRKTWFASHRVRSPSFGVSQRLYSAIRDRNHSGWNLFVQHLATFATVIRSCSIRLDGIRTGFRTLLTARCNHSVQIDLWITTPIRALLGWSTFGRIS